MADTFKYKSKDNKTGKETTSKELLNWKSFKMPSFKGGWKDPHFKAGAMRIDLDDKGGSLNVRGTIKYNGGLKGLWKKIKEGE